MPRQKRIFTKGLIYHVLNRANSKLSFFDQQIDYQNFVDLINDSLKKFKIEIFAYVVMPNHWHFICSPGLDGEISKWMSWLQMRHTQVWHKNNKTKGRGHFYQGRYKSFEIQNDKYFLQVCRYVERNPLKSGLVHKAEDWTWGSLSPFNKVQISDWPIEKPLDYLDYVNNIESDFFSDNFKNGA